MAERTHLEWFRERLKASQAVEPRDPAPILAWLEQRRRAVDFKAELIGLDELAGWSRDARGNVRHHTGQFFAIEGVRTHSGGLREVVSWDQPIYTQPEGGILAMVAREGARGIEFLLGAKAEPGNIGILQLSPSIQSTWSNIKRAHAGKRPPLIEVLTAECGVRIIYRALHNEEGGRFWQKTNENIVAFVDDEGVIATDLSPFHWASISQIKELALMDCVLNPFVKTILAPL